MKQFPKESSNAEIAKGNASDGSSETIEIPVGRWLSSLRRNPWILSTLVLAIALVVVLFLQANETTENVINSGSTITGEEAGAKLLSFINTQGNGEAELISSKQEGALYKVSVKYQGQEIPAYVTLDGQYLVAQPIPLDAEAQQKLLADAPPGDTSANPTNSANPGVPVEINISGSPMKGNKNAKVVFVEFTDYQCPFCSRHYTETYSQIIKNYINNSKVLLVIKDFPLNFHEEAQKAAESAHCVREQKGDTGYFAMHDKLFENQQSLSVENEKKWAKELGVNGDKFDTCLDSGKFAKYVTNDLNYGQDLGVTGTPAFFINGKIIEGACPYTTFTQAFDAELKEQEWSVTNCQVRLS